MLIRLAVSLLAAVAAPFVLPGLSAPDTPAPETPTAALTLVDGTVVEGQLAATTWTFVVGDAVRPLAVADVLSIHRGAAATSNEQARIERGLTALAGDDRAAAEAAAEELVDIGLPVLTPLLDSYVDTDAHEPDLRYRLFARLVPGRADGRDRTLDMARLADGSILRGVWKADAVELKLADGTQRRAELGAIRRIAIRRAAVTKEFELQALHDCTYVSFVDTGVFVTPSSHVTADASGYVRLSFAEDGWATGPDGLHETLPGKRKLQEGFRWGAVLGRVGARGERWFVGEHVAKDGFDRGHLYFVINDNEHWQNNIGSYRVRLVAHDAYDLGDAR